MSSIPAILSLDDWAQQRLTAVLQATTADALTAAFDNFVSKNASIIVNGVQLSREQYIQQLRNQEALDQGATVAFDGTVAVPTNKTTSTDPVSVGIVGLFYVATLILKLRVLGGPEERKVTSSLNITVAQDPSVARPSGTQGIFDARRVTALNQVFIDSPVPITLPK